MMEGIANAMQLFLHFPSLNSSDKGKTWKTSPRNLVKMSRRTFRPFPSHCLLIKLMLWNLWPNVFYYITWEPQFLIPFCERQIITLRDISYFSCGNYRKTSKECFLLNLFSSSFVQVAGAFHSFHRPGIESCCHLFALYMLFI